MTADNKPPEDRPPHRPALKLILGRGRKLVLRDAWIVALFILCVAAIWIMNTRSEATGAEPAVTRGPVFPLGDM